MQEEDGSNKANERDQDTENKKCTSDPQCSETRKLRDLACRRAVKAHKYYFENPQLQNSPTVRLERLHDSFIGSSQVDEKCDITLDDEVSGGKCDNLVNSAHSVSNNNESVNSQESLCNLSQSFSQFSIYPELSNSFDTMPRKKKNDINHRRNSAPETIQGYNIGNREQVQKVERRRATLNGEQIGRVSSFSNNTICIEGNDSTKNTDNSLKMRVNKIGTNMWEVNNGENRIIKTKGKKKENGYSKHSKGEKKCKAGQDMPNCTRDSFSNTTSDVTTLPDNEFPEPDAEECNISEPQNNDSLNQLDISNPSSDSNIIEFINENIEAGKKLDDNASSDDVLVIEQNVCIIILSDEEEDVSSKNETDEHISINKAVQNTSTEVNDKESVLNQNLSSETQSFEEQQLMECEIMECEVLFPVNDTSKVNYLGNEEYAINERQASELDHKDIDISDDEGRADEDRLLIDEDIPCNSNADVNISSAEANTTESITDSTNKTCGDISECLNSGEDKVLCEERKNTNSNINVVPITANDDNATNDNITANTNITIRKDKYFVPDLEDISPANSPKALSVIKSFESKDISKKFRKKVHSKWKTNLESQAAVTSGPSNAAVISGPNLSWSYKGTSSQGVSCDQNILQTPETSSENDSRNTDTIITENNEVETPEAQSTATEKKKKRFKMRKSTGEEEDSQDDINLQKPVKEAEQDRIKVDLPRHNWLQQKLTGNIPVSEENLNTGKENPNTKNINTVEKEMKETSRSVIKTNSMSQDRTPVLPGYEVAPRTINDVRQADVNDIRCDVPADLNEEAILHPILQQLTKNHELQVLSINSATSPRHSLPPQVEHRGTARAIARNTALRQNSTSGNKILMTMSQNASTSFDTAKSIGYGPNMVPQYRLPLDMGTANNNGSHILTLPGNSLKFMSSDVQEKYAQDAPPRMIPVAALGSPNSRFTSPEIPEKYGNQRSIPAAALGSPVSRNRAIVPQNEHQIQVIQQRSPQQIRYSPTTAIKSPPKYSSTSPRSLISPEMAVAAVSSSVTHSFNSPSTHSVHSPSSHFISSPLAATTVSSPLSYSPLSPTSQFVSSRIPGSQTPLQKPPCHGNNNVHSIFHNSNNSRPPSSNSGSNHNIEIMPVRHKRKNSDLTETADTTPMDLSMKKSRIENMAKELNSHETNISLVTSSVQNNNLNQVSSRRNIQNSFSYRNQDVSISPSTSSFHSINNIDKEEKAISHFLEKNRVSVNGSNYIDLDSLARLRESDSLRNRLPSSASNDRNLLTMLRDSDMHNKIVNNSEKIAPKKSPIEDEVVFISEIREMSENNSQTATQINAKSSNKRPYRPVADQNRSIQTTAQQYISKNQIAQQQIVPQNRILLNETRKFPINYEGYDEVSNQSDLQYFNKQNGMNNDRIKTDMNNSLALRRLNSSTTLSVLPHHTTKEDNNNKIVLHNSGLPKLVLATGFQNQFLGMPLFAPQYPYPEKQHVLQNFQPIYNLNMTAALTEKKDISPVDEPKITDIVPARYTRVRDEEPFSQREKSKTKHLKDIQNERHYMHSNLIRHENHRKRVTSNQYPHFNNVQSNNFQMSSKYGISGQIPPYAYQERVPHIYYNGSQVNNNMFQHSSVMREMSTDQTHPNTRHYRYRNEPLQRNQVNFEPRIIPPQHPHPPLLPSPEHPNNQRRPLLPTPTYYQAPQASNYSDRSHRLFPNSGMILQQHHQPQQQHNQPRQHYQQPQLQYQQPQQQYQQPQQHYQQPQHHQNQQYNKFCDEYQQEIIDILVKKLLAYKSWQQ